MNNILKMTALLLVSNCVMAEYTVNIPLEISKSGALPDGSINFGTPSTTPNNPTNPTEPEQTNCHFDLTSNFSAYAEGYLGENYMKQVVYLGREVMNGTKGKVQFSQDGIDYAEVCFGNSTPIYKVDNNEDAEWITDDCRHNMQADQGAIYYWKEIDGKDEYSTKKAFTNAVLGSLGEINYQTSGLYFPPGYINTSYGQIQPEDNNMIGRGSVYFYRGNFSYSTNLPSGTEYYYFVCNHTAN